MILNNEKEKIHIFGHKSPDTDSVCSSIAYAAYLRKEGKNAHAFRLGEINPETKYVLEYFGVEIPALLTNGKGKKIILLDHNEKTQSLPDIDSAEISEVIDHHKIDFQWSLPIFFLTEPLGSTSTIIAEKYFEGKVKISKEIAGILLSGILSDTVVFRSPTTTKEDIEMAQKLAKIAGIESPEDFGIEIKKKKANLKGLSAKEIISSDLKLYEFEGKRVAIGQFEVFEINEARERKEELVEKLKEIAGSEKYDLIVLMLTDIIQMGSEILAVGQTDYLEKAFGKKIEDNSFYLKGVISRKKELVPPLMIAFGAKEAD